MERIVDIPHSELQYVYDVQKLTEREIAKRYECSRGCVRRLLDRYKIPRRLKGGAHNQRLFISREELEYLYHDQMLSMKQISDRLGGGKTSVGYWVKKYGLLRTPEMRSESQRRGNLKGWSGRRLAISMAAGYRKVIDRSHPRSDCIGRVAEHVLIVEKAIGRHLLSHEKVHHINLRKTDNRIENLAILNNSQHRSVHAYYERVAIYLLGLVEDKPDPMIFCSPVFWSGRWISELDLTRKQERNLELVSS